jgi:hypothetical protein
LQPGCSPYSADIPHPSKSITYSTALSNLREVLERYGFDGSDYSEHSSKRGAATHSAKVGVPDEDIQIAGGWSNPRSMRLYIDRDPRQSQRFVKKILGITL